jgi:ABC-type transport system involved in cytochrome c biogenesis permease subunit
MTRLIAFLYTLLLLFPCSAQAQQDFEYSSFAQIPVQHEGRIKPLDSFARAYLRLFSGQDSLGGMTADAWLAETLLDPAQALHRPLFRVFQPEALELPARKKKIYSYAELAPALQDKAETIAALSRKDEKDWSDDQRELMRLQEAAILYTQLLRSFTFVLPLNIRMPGSLAKEIGIDPELPVTLESYRLHERDIGRKVKAIIRRKGEDPARYNDKEKALVSFAFDMEALRQAGNNNILLRIIPGQWGGGQGEWFSPWSIINEGQGSPETAAYIDGWKAMAQAYLANDSAAWAQTSAKTAAAAQKFSSSGRTKLELVYNYLHAPTLALGLYFLTFMGIVVYALRRRTWRIACLAALGAGCVVNIAALAARVIILERPPVGTLYESILFVAAICTTISFFYELRRKDGTGLLGGALSGMLLLFIAQSFSEDDTMKMLVAVLNTNFWLATHVLCITTGYGWSLVTALLAHLWLVKRALGHKADELIAPVKTLSLVALLFTAVGTILGGIWADQSWGRFWGWDPKENGALLIVLWLIWLLHGQISGHIKRLYYIAGMALLAVIVALAWFGVNLLSVGLHSYGFITGVAAALGMFCAVELIAVGSLVYIISCKKATV